MREKNQTILERIRTIRGGARLYPRKKCKRYIEDGYISCRGKDVSNVMRRALSCIEKVVKAMRDSITLLYVDNLRRCRALFYVVEVMRAMQWGGLYLILWRRWKQCAAAPNWWLIGVKVARSIDNYRGCFLSRSRFSDRMPSNHINFWAFLSQNASPFTPMLLSNIAWFLTSLIMTFVIKYLAIYSDAARQHCLVSDFSHSDFCHIVPRHSSWCY